MDVVMTWLASTCKGAATLAAINGHLDASGLSISQEDALMLAERRAESLTETERVEFGAPAVIAIAEAIASSPFLIQDNAGEVLADLQDAFYAVRDELPVDVTDAEIVEALCGCFDAHEGDTSEVAATQTSELMGFSDEFVRATEADSRTGYRIIDDEGRAYAFDPAEWDYDEQATGWDGERWADDWDD